MFGGLTEVKRFAYFTDIITSSTTDSDCIVCIVENIIESVTCVLSSDNNIVKGVINF